MNSMKNIIFRDINPFRLSRSWMMGLRISLRVKEKISISVVSRLDQEMIKAFRAVEKDAFHQSFRYGVDEFRSAARQKDFRALIFRNSNDQVVGFCTGYHDPKDDEGVYFLDVLAFSSEYRKRGIAPIVKPALERIKELGYSKAYLFADDFDIDQTPLVPFYLRFGFSYQGETSQGHRLEIEL